MANRITWQAYTYMSVVLECLDTGYTPNGQKINRVEELEHVRRCTEILNEYGCDLPTLKQKPQLSLF